MNIKKLLGCVLISIPFIGVFIFMVLENGFMDAIVTFSLAGLLMGCIVIGINLTTGS